MVGPAEGEERIIEGSSGAQYVVIKVLDPEAEDGSLVDHVVVNEGSNNGLEGE